MSVTLNYTSKGLIDAIQKQLAQQKSEGKISGDTSYKSIATCDFWSTLKTINDNHDKKNKVYHGSGYSCNDRGKVTDWTKSVVVYGSTTFTDEEWEALVHSMGLELTSKGVNEGVNEGVNDKVNNEENNEVNDKPQTENNEQEVAPIKEEENNEDFAMTPAVMGTLMTELTPELEKAGYDGNQCVYAAKITQTKLKCKVVLNTDKKLEIYQHGNKLSKDDYLKLLFTELAKDPNINKTETLTNTNTDDENCTDDEAQ